jgi:enterochelin esterase-like enzyme
MCLTQPGRLENGSIRSTKPAQEFLIYLPPCYDQQTAERYPVLYLLHGQTYTDSQWVGLGAVTAADVLIRSGAARPFIIVFPDDRYWNLPPGPQFGHRLVDTLVPFIDQNYRTLADRDHRSLGGLSRGGGWAIHMLLTHYDLFGSIGLHSPVIFEDDAGILERLVTAVPADSWSRLWIDGGDRDGGLGDILAFETLLTEYEVPHEWRMYAGDHTNPYWQAHVIEYLQWYADGFGVPNAQVPSATSRP